MIRKMRSLLPAVLGLFLTFALIASAGGQTVSAAKAYPHIYDGANLLTSSEEAELEAYAVSASEEAKADISVVTVNDLGGKSAMDFADDWYDYNGYGVGEDRSGVLLLVCMGTREYWVSTCGAAGVEFSDSDLEKLEDKFVSELSYGEYYEAFEAFIKGVRNELVPKNYGALRYLLECLAGGVLASLIPVQVMKGKNKSIKRARGAAAYVKPNSMRVTKQGDYFLYRTINRVHIQQQNRDSGGGMGGGHVSSSGTSHGGSGGHF